MTNVAPYTAPSRSVGDSGFTADVNAAYAQIAAANAFLNNYSGGGYAEPDVIYAGAYGATGNGADSTNAINQAIQAAKAQRTAAGNTGIYVVMLPLGDVGVANSYKNDASYKPQGIKIESGVELWGRSRERTRLVILDSPSDLTFKRDSMVVTSLKEIDFNSGYSSNGQFFSAITGTNVTGAAVRNLTITCTLAKQRNVVYVNGQPNAYLMPYDIEVLNLGNVATHGVLWSGGSGNEVSNVLIENIPGAGIRYYNSPDGLVSGGSELRNCVSGGFMTYGNCPNTKMVGGTSHHNYSDGVRLHSTRSKLVGVTTHSARTNSLGVDFPQYAGVYSEVGTYGGQAARGTADFIELEGVISYNNSANGLDLVSDSWTATRCHVHHNANIGIQTHGVKWTIKGNLIEDNGVDLAGNSDNPTKSTYLPFGINIDILDTQRSIIEDNIFRNSTGKQQFAIGTRDGGKFLNTKIYGNSATGQGLFQDPNLDPSNDPQNNFPTANNGYTRQTTPREDYSPAAYVPLTADGNRAIQWDLQAAPNGTFSIPAGLPPGIYGPLLLNAAGKTGQLKITNNSSTTQQFAIPSEVNHYQFGTQTKLTSIAPNETAYYLLNVYLPAEGNYANWFYESLGGGVAAIGPGTVIRYDDPRIVRADITGGTPWTENTQFGITYIYGSGTLTLQEPIAAGLRYRIKALKSEFFGAFHLKENGVEVATPDLSLPDGAGFTPAEVIYERPTALPAAINKIETSFATVGKSYSFLQIEFF